VWIVLALVFNAGIYFVSGKEKALEFLTGYLIEKALSIDNVFVFLIIFAHFGVPAESEKRVNFWGSLSAVIMRLVFILAGVALLERFHWSIYPFGAMLILSNRANVSPDSIWSVRRAGLSRSQNDFGGLMQSFYRRFTDSDRRRSGPVDSGFSDMASRVSGRKLPKRNLKARASSPGLRKTLKLTTSRYKRRQTHAAASTRRRQAKRDSRGRR
jgi:hypothetical protein